MSEPLRVQFLHPITGELVARVPAAVCGECHDVVLGSLKPDGRCACCVERFKRPKRLQRVSVR